MKIAGLQAVDVPDWLGAFIALTRPIVVTALAAIPTLGALTVGTVSAFNPDAGMAMASASVTFLQGIPEAGWLVIAGVAGIYTGAKAWEVTKGGPPAEAAPAAPPIAPPAAEAWPPVAMSAETEEERGMPQARGANPAGAGPVATPTLDLE